MAVLMEEVTRDRDALKVKLKGTYEKGVEEFEGMMAAAADLHRSLVTLHAELCVYEPSTAPPPAFASRTTPAPDAPPPQRPRGRGRTGPRKSADARTAHGTARGGMGLGRKAGLLDSMAKELKSLKSAPTMQVVRALLAKAPGPHSSGEIIEMTQAVKAEATPSQVHSALQQLGNGGSVKKTGKHGSMKFTFTPKD